jgi:exonuclease VII small subunit
MTSGTFVNPKVGASCDPVDLWYRYYAGYSAGFVEQALKESAATAKLVLDPWNGSARGKGGLYHYYACTARQKYGPKACQGQRISREKLETAVLHQLTGIYRDGPLIQNALATAQQQAERERPALDERRQAIAAEITRTEHATARYFDAFEEGRLSPERCEQRLADLTTRLDDLRAQQAELSNNDDEAAHTPTAADLAAVADRLDNVLAQGEPEQTKALLRILIAELRVNSKTSIQPTYRIITPGGLRNVRKSGDHGKKNKPEHRVDALRRALAEQPTQPRGSSKSRPAEMRRSAACATAFH